jgi:hypothetical protein
VLRRAGRSPGAGAAGSRGLSALGQLGEWRHETGRRPRSTARAKIGPSWCGLHRLCARRCGPSRREVHPHAPCTRAARPRSPSWPILPRGATTAPPSPRPCATPTAPETRAVAFLEFFAAEPPGFRERTLAGSRPGSMPATIRLKHRAPRASCKPTNCSSGTRSRTGSEVNLGAVHPEPQRVGLRAGMAGAGPRRRSAGS